MNFQCGQLHSAYKYYVYLAFQALDEIAARMTTCESTASVQQVIQTIHQQGKK